MAKWVFIDGFFIEEEKAVLSFKDISFQRGYGIFDFFRLVGNKPLFLDDHLDRFFLSAAGMHLPVPFTREEIKTAVFDLVARNNLPETGIRLSLTGGNAEDGFTIGQPAFLLSQHSFIPPSEEQVQKGISLLSCPHQRQLPHIKSIDYLMAVWLQPKRIAAGKDDILYYQNGLISESPRSNFFLVTADDVIVTPAENVLAGVTRRKVIELATKHFAVEERAVSMEEIKTAKEAFLTSTTKQILPVSQVDETIFRQRKVAHHLLGLSRSYCAKA
jgi:branched-subunit amino acid aminotransferase/4-amino-4-deoxychorismate lyase